MTCECWFDLETGYFEACCEEHEREYVEYLLQTAREQNAERLRAREEGGGDGL